MTRADVALLEILQANANQSVAELALAAGMSTSACHRRMKTLEEQGYIAAFAARLNPDHLKLDLHIFVEISLTSQSEEAMGRFEAAVVRFDDILECHLMSGSADYILRVAATDLANFDRIHRTCLARLPGVSAMRTSFSIRRIKEWTGYPVRQLLDG